MGFLADIFLYLIDIPMLVKRSLPAEIMVKIAFRMIVVVAITVNIIAEVCYFATPDCLHVDYLE